MSSYLKMIEGMGLVAGLNKSNKKIVFVGQELYDTGDRTGCSTFRFSLVKAYEEAISYERELTRRMKRHHPDYVSDRLVIEQSDLVFAADYAQSGENGFFCGSEAQFEAQKKEDRRLELEAAAKQFAASKKVKLSSMEFIAAINDEIDSIREEYDSYNSYERQAEDYAAHMYSGTQSSYFDDKNYTNSQYSVSENELYDIRNWLREECPLLWAKYEESKLEADSE